MGGVICLLHIQYAVCSAATPGAHNVIWHLAQPCHRRSLAVTWQRFIYGGNVTKLDPLNQIGMRFMSDTSSELSIGFERCNVRDLFSLWNLFSVFQRGVNGLHSDFACCLLPAWRGEETEKGIIIPSIVILHLYCLKSQDIHNKSVERNNSTFVMMKT